MTPRFTFTSVHVWHAERTARGYARRFTGIHAERKARGYADLQVCMQKQRHAD